MRNSGSTNESQRVQQEIRVLLIVLGSLQEVRLEEIRNLKAATEPIADAERRCHAFNEVEVSWGGLPKRQS